MSIYVHYTPYRLRSGSWPSMKEAVLKGVLSTLERFAPGIGGLVLAAEVITPLELESRFGFHGAISSTGNFRWISWQSCGPQLRLQPVSRAGAGLFMCSAGTHPGGFMSGSSGKLAAHEVVKAARP